MIPFLFLVVSFLMYPVIVVLHFLLWSLGRIDQACVSEKCGFIKKLPFAAKETCLWVHVSSFGEYNTARGFIGKLHRRFNKPIFLTYYRQDVAPKAAQDNFIYGHHCMPLENYLAYKRLIEKTKPEGVFIFETEIWPVFIYALKRKNVRVYLLSGGIFDQDFRSYRRFRALFRETMGAYRQILAASGSDREKFLALGANPRSVQVGGSLKYDLQRPEQKNGSALKREFGFDQDTFILTAGSVHKREDIMLIHLFLQLCRHLERFVLIVAPRYLNRVENMRRYLEHQNLSYRCRTDDQRPVPAPPYVFILDTLGELNEIYSLSDLVFVGGSLVPCGGHNVLEPIFYNKKTFVGPYNQNYADIIKQFSAYIDVVRYSDMPRYILKHTSCDVDVDNGRSLLMTLAGAGDTMLSQLDFKIDR
jgi:3-deoxy-D-manno-octulosonic-acid transferase